MERNNGTRFASLRSLDRGKSTLDPPDGEAGGENVNSFVVGLLRGPTSGAVDPK